MARIIKLNDGGNELTFEIKAMSAIHGEKWFIRAVKLLGENVDITKAQKSPEKVLQMLCAMPFDEAYSLLNELLGCVSKIDGKIKTQVTIEDLEGYISHPATIFTLRKEAFTENLGFFTELYELFIRELGSMNKIAGKSKG